MRSELNVDFLETFFFHKKRGDGRRKMRAISESGVSICQEYISRFKLPEIIAAAGNIGVSGESDPTFPPFYYLLKRGA